MKTLILLVAQGFGIGRIPGAPGTWGSVLGLLWFTALVWPANLLVYLVGTALGIAASVWFCGEAEKILKATDPQSVVLDEISVIPLCFLGWVLLVLAHGQPMPGPAYFLEGKRPWLVLAVFVAFRFFDIVKPWPIRQSQDLPGGWGVTVDDVLAAVFTAMIGAALAYWRTSSL